MLSWLLILQLVVMQMTRIHGKTCNVLDYGAKGDGQTNDTDAILNAIKDCGQPRNDTTPSILLFPSSHHFQTGPFAIDPSSPDRISWSLPNSKLIVSANTSINNAITDPAQWPSGHPPFIHLLNLSDFSVVGHNLGAFKIDSLFQNLSVIDGAGAQWWHIRKSDPSHFAPKLLQFDECANLSVVGLTLQNSPKFHLCVSKSSNVRLSNLTITAPADSPNTDAVDVSGDTAEITRCYLSTGDDNIAIKPDAYNMRIADVYCGHGHGGCD